MRRLTGLLTAVAVAVCPALFAVCAEQCAHFADNSLASSPHQHAAVAETAGPAVSSMPGHVHSSETTDADGEPGTCHHDSPALSDHSSEHFETADAAPEPASASRMAADCSQCFGEGPVLIATRGSDDAQRVHNGGAVVAMSSSTRQLAAFAPEAQNHLAASRHAPPPSPPSSSTVLRI